ncbi:hypothetical protein L9F63_011509, partial [Diploptera punctata]
NPDYGIKLRGMYGHVLFLSQCLGLSCIAAQICMKYHTEYQIAYLHVGSSFIPIKAYILILTFHLLIYLCMGFAFSTALLLKPC